MFVLESVKSRSFAISGIEPEILLKPQCFTVNKLKFSTSDFGICPAVDNLFFRVYNV